MPVSHKNGVALSGVSHINGVAISTVGAISGQEYAGDIPFDIVVNFSDGSGALTATKLNNGTHGATSWGTWAEVGAIDYTTIEDHDASLPFNLICNGVSYNGTEAATKGLTFDFSTAPTNDDVFSYVLSGTRQDCVFLILVKFATIASGSPVSYNNDIFQISGADYTIIQRQHSFNGTKTFYAHAEGDLGGVIPDPEDWVIICGRHNVIGGVGEMFVQAASTGVVLGASEVTHTTPAGDTTFIRLQSYLRGANQGTGNIKVKLMALRDSDLTWPPYPITVPAPTSLVATQTAEDEVTLTWSSDCQIFKVERNKNAAGWTTLSATYNNNGIDPYVDTDVADGDDVDYRITAIIGAYLSTVVDAAEITVDNAPYAAPTWTDSMAGASTDGNALYPDYPTMQQVVCGTTGNCTKLRVWIRDYNSAMSFKVALYNSSHVKIGQGSVTSLAGSSGAWAEVTLDAAVAVTSGTTYGVGFCFPNQLNKPGLLASQPANTSYLDFGSSYAAFPTDPYVVSGNGVTWKLAVGMGVV